MRVLAISPYYSPEGGGLERYAHEILRRMAAKGHHVEAVSFTRGTAARHDVDGVDVTRLAPTLRVGNTPVGLGFRRHVRDRIRRARPDVVVAHTPVPFPAEMAYLAARAESVPFVVTYHAGSLRGSNPLLGALAAVDRHTYERRMLRGADRLIAVSPYVRRTALAGATAPVDVVPPGVDTSVFRPGGPPDPASILFVGPLSRSYRWKGIDVLWRAMDHVRARRPDARLTVVGDGDRLVEFVRKAAADPGAVRILRRLSDAELAHAYASAAVTVLPSTTDAESFGMVLAEANACARPVVGSRIGGIADFIRDGDNGLLARPGDAAGLAAAILRIIDAPAEAARMGERGRRRVEREHDWDLLAMRTEAVLADAARPGDRRDGSALERPAASLERGAAQ